MSARKLNGVWPVIASTTLAAAIGMASASACAEGASAPAPSAVAAAGQQRAAVREKDFWLCDYVATTRGVQFTPMEYCGQVMDELKAHKFGGDYERLVQWWRDRKPAEHTKIRLGEER